MCFVTDEHMGKIIGEPYRGKPDVRLDEGGKGKDTGWEPAVCDGC